MASVHGGSRRRDAMLYGGRASPCQGNRQQFDAESRAQARSKFAAPRGGRESHDLLAPVAFTLLLLAIGEEGNTVSWDQLSESRPR
jgi:hypothetical protein